MTERQLAALAIRVLAVYCVVLALTQVQQVMLAIAYYWGALEPPRGGLEYLFAVPYSIWSLLIATAPFVVYSGAAVLLWQFAGSIAKHVAPDDGENNIALALDSYAIHVITFSAIGVIIVAHALPYFIQLIFDAISSRGDAYFYSSFSSDRYSSFISVVQMLFGLSLIYGRERIVQGIHTIRDIKNLGRDPSFPSDNPPTSQP